MSEILCKLSLIKVFDLSETFHRLHEMGSELDAYDERCCKFSGRIGFYRFLCAQ